MGGPLKMEWKTRSVENEDGFSKFWALLPADKGTSDRFTPLSSVGCKKMG